MPNDADIKQILCDVALNVEVNVGQLREDLSWSHTWFETRQAVSKRHRLAVELAKVKKTALKLERLLEQAEIGSIIGTYLSVTDACEWLQSIANAAVPPAELNSESAVVEAQLADELGFTRRGAFEWLVARFIQIDG